MQHIVPPEKAVEKLVGMYLEVLPFLGKEWSAYEAEITDELRRMQARDANAIVFDAVERVMTRHILIYAAKVARDKTKAAKLRRLALFDGLIV